MTTICDISGMAIQKGVTYYRRLLACKEHLILPPALTNGTVVSAARSSLVQGKYTTYLSSSRVLQGAPNKHPDRFLTAVPAPYSPYVVSFISFVLVQ